ncbi:MAG: hypothetical protein JWN94_2819 [Betaproteobacteria bacterium]|nr:hypothetical protein [Betaproteobacteria bacterium]
MSRSNADEAKPNSVASRRLKLGVLIVTALIAVIAVALQPPIAQDPGYHQFADQRLLLGVPNFWNVVSNVAFLVVGVIGVAQAAARRSLPMRAMYLSFFAGTCLVAFGSGYYHLAPGNETLLWDRLPMVIAFMAFFSIIVGTYIDENAGSRLYGPLLAVGLASVVYWHFTEQAGHGDLRAYVIAQFLPIMLIPLIVLLFPSRLSSPKFVWAVIGAYVVAKLFELADAQVFTMTDAISGHTLKHLAAALGAYFFLRAMRQRHAAILGR